MTMKTLTGVFLSKISDLYGIKADIQFDLTNKGKMELKLTIPDKMFSDETVVLDFRVADDDSVESAITRFKQEVFKEYSEPYDGRFGTDVDFKTILKKVFSTYQFEKDGKLSVFYTDHQPQYEDLSCNKLYIKGRFRESHWEVISDTEANMAEFHQNNIQWVKESVAGGYKHHRTNNTPFPEVDLTGEIRIAVPQDNVSSGEMTISYVENIDNGLVVTTYKFNHNSAREVMENWGIRYEYSTTPDGLLSIKTQDVLPKLWMESIKSERDFEEHPFNAEIHGKLGDIAKPVYAGSKAWVTNSDKLFVKIGEQWIPVDLGYIHYADRFLPDDVFQELQMASNTIQASE